MDPTVANVAYGSHPKQILSFWKADTEKPAPLLIWYHGGGWVKGGHMVSAHDYVPDLLDHGISFVSVEYRFLGEADRDGVYPPVKGPLHDAARALQMVRSKAVEWHLDKTRVMAAGASAGACTSLWLAFHDDLADPSSSDPVARESTRLMGAAVASAQTSLDPKQMRKWMPNIRYGGHAFGIVKAVQDKPLSLDQGSFEQDFDAFLARREELWPLIQEYSPYQLASANAPPIYMVYGKPPAMGQEQDDPTHSANFGVKLQERLRELNVPCELIYPGAPDVKHPKLKDYIVAMLNG